MGSESDGALRALREAEEFAKSYRFELSDDYLALIDAVEAMPRNQSGSDKTGRWLGRRAPAAAPVTKGASSRSGQ
jgi:hypothetical protein